MSLPSLENLYCLKQGPSPFLHCDKPIGRLQGSIAFEGVGNPEAPGKEEVTQRSARTSLLSPHCTSRLPGTLDDYYYPSGRKPLTSNPIGRDAARAHGSLPVLPEDCANRLRWAPRPVGLTSA